MSNISIINSKANVIGVGNTLFYLEGNGAKELAAVLSEALERNTFLHQLRAPLRDFVGRKDMITILLDILRSGRHVVICGLPGSGKTELALMIANLAIASYPDAQLVVDLKGGTEKPASVADALGACVQSFGTAPEMLADNVEGLSKAFRSKLSRKRALILLDDASDIAQVGAFLPPENCVLIVTARIAFEVPGGILVPIAQLQAEETEAYLQKVVPRLRPEASKRISALCGHLPLALSVIAHHFREYRDQDPERVIARLAKESLHSDKGALLHPVERSLELAYSRLPRGTARTFRCLSLFSGTFDGDAEEHVCEDRGHQKLSDLVRWDWFNMMSFVGSTSYTNW
jgi:energy-coupling factor transporter ATP-binding protein EcfA2